MIMNTSAEIIQGLKAGIGKYRSSSAEFRIECLDRLEKCIIARKDDMVAALKSDFQKPELEALYTDIYVVLNEIRYAKKHLRKWMKPKSASFRIATVGSQFYSYPESKGLVLIISPWNYPFNLSLIPLVNVIAAGNTAILKPSEFSPSSSALIKSIVEQVFASDHVAVVKGGAEVGATLLEEQFNHIIFTGSQRVARIVMAKAAEFCTPVTLELGGKNPLIIAEDANLRTTAERIVWGKWMNAGQTCLGVDYVLVQENISEAFQIELLKAMESSFAELFPKSNNEDIASIIHQKAFDQQIAWLDEAIDLGAQVIAGNYRDKKLRYISPTVLRNVPSTAALMQHEVFGPILPLLTFKTKEQALEMANSHGNPLCAYIFSRSREFQSYMLRNLSSGSFGINDLIAQFYHPALPFGGINHSGMGKTHGKWGFDEFSHHKAVIRNRFSFNWIKLVRAPYSDFKKKIANIVIRWL